MRYTSDVFSNQKGRYNSDLGFPLLDSFPDIYLQDSSVPRSSSVHVKMETSTSISAWIHSVARNSRSMFGFEERERIINGLQEIAETYAHGHGGDMDDWDD